METAKQYSRDNRSVADVLASGASLLTNHINEIVKQAETYLEELRAAAAGVQQRIRAGILRLQPQPQEDEPMPDSRTSTPAAERDPIFATQEFEAAPESAPEAETSKAARGLVSFDEDE